MSHTDAFDYAMDGVCLKVHLLNGDVFQKTESTIRQIAELIDAQKPRITVIDFRDVLVKLTFLDRYELGEMAGRYLAGRLIGALVRPDQADPTHIGKVVALNRGVLVELFTDAAAADAWVARYRNPPPLV